MSQQKITQLTPDQEALIPVYRDKWKAIALSTGSTNRQKSTEAVDSAYIAIGLYLPLLFFSTAAKSARVTVIPSLLGN